MTMNFLWPLYLYSGLSNPEYQKQYKAVLVLNKASIYALCLMFYFLFLIYDVQIHLIVCLAKIM